MEKMEPSSVIGHDEDQRIEKLTFEQWLSKMYPGGVPDAVAFHMRQAWNAGSIYRKGILD